MFGNSSAPVAAVSPRLLIVICSFTILSGCGSPLIQPDRSTHPAPAGTQIQPRQVESPQTGGVTNSELRSLPRVPASSALRTDDRQPRGTYHEVRMGETLSAIARVSGTTIEQLLKANGLERDATLQPGQLIFIPQ